MGLRSPSRVDRGRAKNAKNQYLVILGIPEIQLDISFCGSMLERVVQLCNFSCGVRYIETSAT